MSLACLGIRQRIFALAKQRFGVVVETFNCRLKALAITELDPIRHRSIIEVEEANQSVSTGVSVTTKNQARFQFQVRRLDYFKYCRLRYQLLLIHLAIRRMLNTTRHEFTVGLINFLSFS